MQYYARIDFVQNPITKSVYLVKSKFGEVANLRFPKYCESTKNNTLGITGIEFMRFSEPRNPAVKKFFAHTFELGKDEILTSTEEINYKGRTFGDGKRLGSTDLIFFQFSEDMSKLSVYFLKDKAKTISEKKLWFNKWNNNEALVAE